MTMALDRIVVGVDGSGGGLHALAWTVPMAKALGAEVLLVRSYDPMVEMMATAERMEFDQLRATAAERLAGPWAQPLIDAGVTHRTFLAEGDDDVAALIAVATDNDAGLIVIGNVGLTGWRERIVGSFAARVLQLSPLPVTVVPQPKPQA
jgi:nucleotide-binding universal stress UspA family protein